MLLSDIFRKLGHGELSSYFVGDELISTNKAVWPEIIDHINTGLTNLHTKFPLIETEVMVQQYEHIAKYNLDSRYAESNTASTEKYKYIKDSVFEPFTDNVLRIERIYSECWEEIPLNDPNECCSIFTSGYNQIQVPTPIKENALLVVYRGDHTRIPVGVKDPTTVEVRVPHTLEEALLTYIAHRYLQGKNTENTSNLAARAYAKYASICNDVEDKDLIRQSHGGVNTHPCIQGWV